MVVTPTTSLYPAQRVRVRRLSSSPYHALRLAGDDDGMRTALLSLGLLALLAVGVAGGGDLRRSTKPTRHEPPVDLLDKPLVGVEEKAGTKPRKQPKLKRPARLAGRRTKGRTSPRPRASSGPGAVSPSGRGSSPRPAAPGRSSEVPVDDSRRAAPARRPAPVVARPAATNRGASPAEVPRPVPAGSDGDEDGGADADNDGDVGGGDD